MNKLKVIECSCGEDVYENDYGDDPRDGYVWCINCGKHYPVENLEEVEVPEIKENL